MNIKKGINYYKLEIFELHVEKRYNKFRLLKSPYFDLDLNLPQKKFVRLVLYKYWYKIRNCETFFHKMNKSGPLFIRLYATK